MVDSAFPEDTWDNFLYLIRSPPEKVHEMNISIMKKILGQGFTPLIITANQPYKVLAKTYLREGIDISKIYVIDTVTQYSCGICEESPG